MADSATLLPPLRQDLRLMRGAPDEDGAPRWLLFDAMRNKYFAISKDAFQLVRHWKSGVPLDTFLNELATRGYDYSPEEISAFADFMINNNLVVARDAQASGRLYQQHAAQVLGFWRWLIHNYLFIRIPLLRPDPWLVRWMPRIQWLFSPSVHYGIMLLGIVGIILVLRQPDAFLATFLHFFTLEGLVLYGLTLAFVKSAHELGHAVAAKRQGCRVASMGIAFLVLFPVLYTDTTDAWRLTSRARRLRIVTAGVRVEIYLALLATFLWNVLPDGPLRSAAFFVATTSWVTSLLINISPFLRFDGYYAFSDWLGMENLQHRAFAMGRWSLRKSLLGLDDPLPEPLPRHRARIMILYAWLTWIYRFFLFLGIALLVYHFFFKVLGILLFIVEILWFILLPMFNELKVWWQKRSGVVLNTPRLLFVAVMCGSLIWLILPISVDVHVPAVMKAQLYQKHFAPEPARVAEVLVHPGDSVVQGQLLLRLESDQLQFARNRVAEEIDLINRRLMRSASSVREKEIRAILAQQLKRLQEHAAGIEARLARMEIRATQSGRVTQMTRLHEGVWVGTKEPLISIVDLSRMEVEGYLSGAELDLVRPGQPGLFIGNQGLSSAAAVTLSDIDIGATHSLAYKELGSSYGGNIAVRLIDDGQLVPEDGRYRIRFKITDTAPELSDQRLPGVVVVEAEPRSWLWYQIRRAIAVIIRETGF